MQLSDDLEPALRAALPPALREQAPSLAQHLIAAAAGEQLANPPDDELLAALRTLAGERVPVGDSVVSFGSGNQFGDVSIGEVAGGDIIKLTLSPVIAPHARGDVVIAHVPPGSQGVTVGKNIIQIGQLVVPIWALLALPAMLLAVALAAYLALRGPNSMAGSGTFNIAVASFGDAAGPDLSQLVYRSLLQQQAQYQAVNAGDVITIWHDSMSWRDKSGSIGAVATAEAPDRERSARELIDKLAADMLIYGERDASGRVALRFYLRPKLGGQGAAATIAGDYQLGDSLAPAPSGTSLTTRAGALFWLIKALQYDRDGRQEQALRVLARANEALPDWGDRGEGKELMWLFQAQAEAFLAQRSPDQPAFEARLRAAEIALANARSANSSFLRAAVVEGSLAALWAQCRLGATDLPCSRLPEGGPEQAIRIGEARAFLEQALAAYSRAEALSVASPDQLWAEGVAPTAKGFALYLRGESAFIELDDPAAELDYARAAVAIEAGLPILTTAGDQRLIGQYQLALGTIYLRRALIATDPAVQAAHKATARAAFAACIAQGEGADDRVLAEQVVALCVARAAQVSPP